MISVMGNNTNYYLIILLLLNGLISSCQVSKGTADTVCYQSKKKYTLAKEQTGTGADNPLWQVLQRTDPKQTQTTEYTYD